MSQAKFRPVPFEKILQHNIPPGMHYAFAFDVRTVSLRLEENLFEQAVVWCEENLVERYPCDPARWSADRRYFFRIFIRGEADAAAFKLRWC